MLGAMAIDRELLSQGIAALGIEVPDGAFVRLARYGDEIELWNPTYGLVSAEGRELVVKHLLDSLAPLPSLKALGESIAAARGPGSGAVRLADVGTGAGLPGIPLSIFLPDWRFSLVDRMGKRLRFLENEQALLGLSNVELVESEAERAKGPFDLVTFRAFRPFSEAKLFRALSKILIPGGAFAAWKGRLDSTREELAALSGDPVLGSAAAAAEIVPVKVPFLDDERCLAVLRF